jgi:hypothetical protein
VKLLFHGICVGSGSVRRLPWLLPVLVMLSTAVEAMADVPSINQDKRWVCQYLPEPDPWVPCPDECVPESCGLNPNSHQRQSCGLNASKLYPLLFFLADKPLKTKINLPRSPPYLLSDTQSRICQATSMHRFSQDISLV